MHGAEIPGARWGSGSGGLGRIGVGQDAVARWECDNECGPGLGLHAQVRETDGFFSVRVACGSPVPCPPSPSAAVTAGEGNTERLAERGTDAEAATIDATTTDDARNIHSDRQCWSPQGNERLPVAAAQSVGHCRSDIAEHPTADRPMPEHRGARHDQGGSRGGSDGAGRRQGHVRRDRARCLGP